MAVFNLNMGGNPHGQSLDLDILCVTYIESMGLKLTFYGDFIPTNTYTECVFPIDEPSPRNVVSNLAVSTSVKVADTQDRVARQLLPDES